MKQLTDSEIEANVRRVAVPLLANGFPAQVYDGVWIAPQSFESEAAS